MIIELFSGVGRSLGDEAIRIDFDPKTRPTICADVRFLPLRPGLKVEHLHGSPPCKYFTYAHGRKANMIGLAESFELVGAFYRAVDYLDPEISTMETPKHGRLHTLLHSREIIYKAHDLEKKRTDFYQTRRSLKRSIIPAQIMREMVQSGTDTS